MHRGNSCDSKYACFHNFVVVKTNAGNFGPILDTFSNISSLLVLTDYYQKGLQRVCQRINNIYYIWMSYFVHYGEKVIWYQFKIGVYAKHIIGFTYAHMHIYIYTIYNAYIIHIYVVFSFIK